MITHLIKTTSRSRWIMILLLSVSLLSSGCAGPHFDITREIGLLPPRIEDRSDFYDDARKRCMHYKKNQVSGDCVGYWEAVLWAQDYRSYVRARAILNRDIIYLGGVVALASVGALTGFSALGHTSSDAYVTIPIVGTFLGGLLAYSKNDALYEAYEEAGMKIDQTLRQAEDSITAQSTRDYDGAAAIIRRDVGSAIDELIQTKIEIVKFQSKSHAEQFKEIHATLAERDLSSFSLTDIATDKENNFNPTTIIGKLSASPDPQKLSATEMRLRLTDIADGGVTTLRLSSLVGETLKAVIPLNLLDHGKRKFLVEAQARNGKYTLRGAKDLPLNFSKRQLGVEVKGDGSVTYKDSENHEIVCSKNNPCPVGTIRTDQDTALRTMDNKPAHWSPSNCNAVPSKTCTVKSEPPVDTKVTVEFK